MIIRTIKTRKELTLTKFKLHLNNFFYDTKKVTLYLSLQLEIFYFYNNKETKTYLCKKVTVDLNNKKECITFKKIIINNFNNLANSKNKFNTEKVNICYVINNKEYYEQYKNKFKFNFYLCISK
uniref:Uncharacterized protein n=1 Tax=Fomitiporia mediterranea TaxID=208960 RepID=A0A5B9RK33_9AGAM|nr:hypothetical protein Fomme_000085 [Fomitiporia mediterranea]QEG57095.1 hypothetical protein Fomme_000085 [Fomitiporia mediterranea]